MQNNKKVIQKFQIEELEHRYEMAWASNVEITVFDIATDIPI